MQIHLQVVIIISNTFEIIELCKFLYHRSLHISIHERRYDLSSINKNLFDTILVHTLFAWTAPNSHLHS